MVTGLRSVFGIDFYDSRFICQHGSKPASLLIDFKKSLTAVEIHQDLKERD
jgi:hypothetical protein